MEDEDGSYVEALETCRAGHEYVVLLWVNSGGTSASYEHEESMLYCPECGMPTEALAEEEAGVSGEELEEVRQYYEVINIRLQGESEYKQRPVHVDVIDARREKELYG